MRKLLVAAFVVAAAFAVVVVVAPWDTAEAVKPEEKGNGLPIGAQRVFSFNLAGKNYGLSICTNGILF